MPRKVKQPMRQTQSMPVARKKATKPKRQPKGMIVKNVKTRGY